MEIQQKIKLSSHEIKALICKGLGLKPDRVSIKYDVVDDIPVWKNGNWVYESSSHEVYGCVVEDRNYE